MTTTIIPLGGAGGPRTAFDPSILDVTRSQKHPTTLLRKRGKTLSYNDFSSGTTEGFNPNMGGFAAVRNTTQVSTGYPLNGSHTLLLATGEEHYSKDVQSRNADAVKRMTLVNDDWETVSVSMMFALVGSGVPSATLPGHDAERPRRYPWLSFFLGFDMQEATPSDGRRFPVLMLRDRGTQATYQSPAWFISPDRYDAAGNATGAAQITIPGTADLFTGGNERKGGYTYARLTYKRGVGYIEAQINSKTFDLRSLGGGLGRDRHLDSSSWDNFRSGFNVIFALNRSSINPDFRSNRAYVDHVWVTVGDQLAE